MKADGEAGAAAPRRGGCTRRVEPLPGDEHEGLAIALPSQCGPQGERVAERLSGIRWRRLSEAAQPVDEGVAARGRPALVGQHPSGDPEQPRQGVLGHVVSFRQATRKVSARASPAASGSARLKT